MLSLLKDTAKRAGRILKIRFLEMLSGKASEVMEKAKSDFVTPTDVEVENYIKELLSPSGMPVVGEESFSGKLPPSCILIDPIDGTRNFMRGNPHFAVNIAYVEDKRVICGVTYDPIKGEMFFAQKGKGAFLNGERLKVSSNREPSKAAVAIGLPYRGKELIELQTCIYKSLFLAGCASRHTGSAALDLAYVAAGRYDAIIYFHLSPWDVAPGILLVEEAGGRVEGLMGRKALEGWLLADNNKLHGFLKGLLGECIKKCGGYHEQGKNH